MKFYNRETEIKLLNDNELLSQENAVFTVISGRRRIGKTSLILKSLENFCLNGFVLSMQINA
jgi:hypothetical protein